MSNSPNQLNPQLDPELTIAVLAYNNRLLNERLDSFEQRLTALEERLTATLETLFLEQKRAFANEQRLATLEAPRKLREANSDDAWDNQPITLREGEWESALRGIHELHRHQEDILKRLTRLEREITPE